MIECAMLNRISCACIKVKQVKKRNKHETCYDKRGGGEGGDRKALTRGGYR